MQLNISSLNHLEIFFFRCCAQMQANSQINIDKSEIRHWLSRRNGRAMQQRGEGLQRRKMKHLRQRQRGEGEKKRVMYQASLCSSRERPLTAPGVGVAHPSTWISKQGAVYGVVLGYSSH